MNTCLAPLLVFLICVACNSLAAQVPAGSGSAQATPATESTPASPAQQTPSYRLAPNDIVEIKVYQEEDLATRARIAQDGTISFPLIGVVAIGGKTIAQASEMIRTRLDRDYLVNPQVTLIVAEYSKRRFTVLGQVEKPGSFEIPSEETVTLLQAIAMAGGYTRLADRGRVKVTRLQAGKSVTETIDTKHEANAARALAYRILPEDTINVPERFF